MVSGLGLLMLGACSGDDHVWLGAAEELAVGSVTLAIGTDGELTVASVSYVVADAAGATVLSDTVALAEPMASVSVQLGLPPGESYTITLTARTGAGTECSGSAIFFVTAGATQHVFVDLLCAGEIEDDEVGTTVVEGHLVPAPAPSCPEIAYYSASPIAAPIGGVIQLTGGATRTPSGTELEWSSSSGSLHHADRAVAQLTCIEPGPVSLTFSVTKGSCRDTETLELTCLPEGNGGGSAGAGGSSGAGGSTSQGGSAGTGSAPELIPYSFGHGDLAFELVFDEASAEWDVFLFLDNATVDGVPGVDGAFDIDTIAVVTDATFVRPNPDGGFFAPLCVEPGESVYWLPQNNTSAAAQGVPFMGIENAAPSGVFVGDVVALSLVSVDSPSGTGAYSLWKDGFPPAFSLSSCDGIDASDTLSLPAGHDHFNMGFSPEPGLWAITYRVSGQLAAGGEVSATFSVSFLLQ